MSRFLKKDAARVFVLMCLMAAAARGSHLLLARQTPAKTVPFGAKAIPAVSPYIEAHTHFDEKNPAAAVQAALQGMQRQNASMIFFLAPPDTFDSPGKFDTDLIIPLLKKYPG